MRKSIPWFYKKRNTKKVRTALAELIDHRIKLIRTGSHIDDDGKAIIKRKSHLKYFHLINRKGGKYSARTAGYGKEHPQHGQVAKMLGKHNGILKKDEKISMINAMGYYPHVFYKNEWRPLYFQAIFQHNTISDMQFWCFLNTHSGKRKVWSIKRSYGKLMDSLTGQAEELAIAEEVSPPSLNFILPQPTPKQLRETLRLNEKRLIKAKRENNKMGIKITTKLIKQLKEKLQMEVTQ